MVAAVVRHVLTLLALAGAIVFFAAADSHATPALQHDLDASAGHPLAAASPQRTQAPCKRHKTRSGHPCPVCGEHAALRAFSRNRNSVPVLPPQEAKTSLFTGRTVLAAENTAAQLVLAQGVITEAETVRRDIYARTARVRN